MSLASRPVLSVVVPGRPRPQGSMTLARNPHTGKEFTKYADQTVLHRNLVVGVLRAEWDGDTPLDGPVALRCEFRFARPRSHYGTGRNAGALRPSAPRRWMVSAPDADKAVRLVGDALTVAGVVRDDCLIALMRGEKVWAETDSTLIEVFVLDEEE